MCEPNPKIVAYISSLPKPWKLYAARYAHWIELGNHLRARDKAEATKQGLTMRTRVRIRRDIYRTLYGADALIRAMTLGGGI